MNEIDLRTRRVTKPWRVAFVVYALILTVATHWPELVIGPAGPSDKTVHMLSFGLLLALLWMTRWVPKLTTVFVICAIWAALDEWSQGIAWFRRWSTWQDLAANEMGLLVATVWIWALRPVGRTGNRMRLRLHAYVFEEIFAQRKAWFVLGGVLLACAGPIALLWPILGPSDRWTPVFIAAIVWVTVTLAIWIRIWTSHYRAVLVTRACFSCGVSASSLELDECGQGRCATCDATLHAGFWLEPSPPTLDMLLKFALAPALLGAGLVAGGFLVIGLAAISYQFMLDQGFLSEVLPRVYHVMGTEKEVMRCVDLTVIMVIFAVCTRLYRSRLARHYDQPFRCRHCGHDLRGTPTSAGTGRCGECGVQFVRPPEQRAAAFEDE